MYFYIISNICLTLAKNKETGKFCTSGFDTDRIDNKDGNEEINPKIREDLLMKLKSLAITEDDNDDSDIDDERKSDKSDSDVDDLSCDKYSE